MNIESFTEHIIFKSNVFVHIWCILPLNLNANNGCKACVVELQMKLPLEHGHSIRVPIPVLTALLHTQLLVNEARRVVEDDPSAGPLSLVLDT